MRISVALATYNGARFLRTQLESLAAQTLAPTELVVGDDGSTDGTREAVATFARSAPFPVRVEINPHRLGYADNFLSAASRCAGDLIAFCDQDDVWLPEKLQCSARHFEAGPDNMLMVHNAWVTDEALQKVRPLWPAKLATRYRRLEFRPLDGSFLGFTMIFRRQLMEVPWKERPAGLWSGQPLPHDHWIPFLASVFGGIVLDPAKLALHRQHGHNRFGVSMEQADVTLAQALTVGAGTYTTWGRVIDSWSGHLNDLAAAQGEPERSSLQQAAARYRKLSSLYSARARLYDHRQSRSGMARSVGSLLARGGYRSQRNGGLGVMSFFKDAVRAGQG